MIFQHEGITYVIYEDESGYKVTFTEYPITLITLEVKDGTKEN